MMDEDTLKGLLEMGKAVRMPQKLMDQILPFVGETMKKQEDLKQSNLEDTKRTALESLRTTFGEQGTTEFARSMILANKGLKILSVDAGMQDAGELVKKYGNDPFLLQVFKQKAIDSGENGAPVGSIDGTLSTATTLKEQLDVANRKYQESRNPIDLNTVMDIRDKIDRYR